jgi:hypothetical protein
MHKEEWLVVVTHTRFWFASRPSDTKHHHPFLVFDLQDRLHFHLTVYGKEAVDRLSPGSAQTYLHAILPWFAYLEEDEWQTKAGHCWDAEPDLVRRAVQDYLVQCLRCKVREHRLGFHLVAITSGTKSTVRIFLASLRLFYSVMIQHGYYSFRNPLQDRLSSLLAQLDDDQVMQGEPPQMPERSGVVPCVRNRSSGYPTATLSSKRKTGCHKSLTIQISPHSFLPVASALNTGEIGSGVLLASFSSQEAGSLKWLASP